MSPAQRDKYRSTMKVLPTKRHELENRSLSTHMLMSKSSSSSPPTPARGVSVATISSPAPARRVSVTTPSISQNSSPATKPPPTLKTALPSPATKPLPTVKSSSPATRPEWIAPPGKSSPSQIPAPKFVTTSRRKSISSLSPATSKRNNCANTPETSRLMTRDLDAGEKETPGSVVAGSKSGNGMLRDGDSDGRKRKELKPQGLGLDFSGLAVDARDGRNSVSVPMSPLSRPLDTVLLSVPSSQTLGTATTSMKGVKKLNDNDKDKQEKRDSLSPIPTISAKQTTAVISVSSPDLSNRQNHHSKPHHLSASLLQPSILPPSPSLLHPYISGIHIFPSCTSGSLTHRLVCGHLILTANPEHCLRNCCIAKTTFGTARLKAQGFVANVRGLDEKWECPCCAVEETEEGQAKNCVGVLGREMYEESREDGMKRQKEMVDVELDLDTKVLLLHESRQQKHKIGTGK